MHSTRPALLSLIAQKHRLMIMCLPLESDKPVTDLHEAVGLHQTDVSKHLAKLRSAGVVEFTRYHRVLQYRLTSKELEAIITTLHDLYCSSEK